MERIAYVFCHGLNGQGQYDKNYVKNPYWGGRFGDVVAKLRDRGLNAFAASVSPQGSAWDRACELYAQIAGTRVDYGAAHSRKYGHDRFGCDFSGRALMPAWDEDTRLVLIGHSFGGATIRLFGEMIAHGSDEERATAPEKNPSPLFTGGMAQRIRAIVTLAAPSNGTTAYDMVLDPDFDTKNIKLPLRYKVLNGIMKSRTRIRADGRDPRDWANYDMMLDNAQALNARITTLLHVYYLSVACDATIPGEGGTRVPDRSAMDPLFVKTATLMGCYSGTTRAGCIVDDEWHANDGLVNTISARAPFDAPQKPFEGGSIEKGVWNVMPDLHADHGFFQGGFLNKQDPRPFFQDLIELLESLD